jgi:hypothetical protein
VPTASSLGAGNKAAYSHDSVTSNAFTPDGGALLLVAVLTQGGGDAGIPTIADTFGGLSWTRIGAGPQFSAADGDWQDAELFYATAPTSPGSNTVTVTWPNTGHINTAMIVTAEVQQWRSVAQSATNQNLSGSNASVTTTLGSAPAGNSLVIGVGGTVGPSSIGRPSGYSLVTFLDDAVFATLELQIASGNSQAQALSGIGNSESSAVAIEVTAPLSPPRKPVIVGQAVMKGRRG